MQTFVPELTFEGCAAALDQLRLGRQIVEAQVIYKALTLPVYGWKNHPAVKMWKGHEAGLVAYAKACNDEWEFLRGAEHGAWRTLRNMVGNDGDPADLPWWWGRPEIHKSHRSNLVRKDAEYYAPLFPGTSPDLPYIWPV